MHSRLPRSSYPQIRLWWQNCLTVLSFVFLKCESKTFLISTESRECQTASSQSPVCQNPSRRISVENSEMTHSQSNQSLFCHPYPEKKVQKTQKKSKSMHIWICCIKKMKTSLENSTTWEVAANIWKTKDENWTIILADFLSMRKN